MNDFPLIPLLESWRGWLIPILVIMLPIVAAGVIAHLVGNHLYRQSKERMEAILRDRQGPYHK